MIDIGLCHPGSRAWEFVIARVQEAPELLARYQRATRNPLSDEELAALEPLQVVFTVLMVEAELWTGQRSGRFDQPAIERRLRNMGLDTDGFPGLTAI